MSAPRSEPHVRPRLRCRLGLHRLVDLPRPKNRMMRTFIVRKIQGCTECGVVLTTRFSNGMAGGGTHRCGYLPPEEVKELSDAEDQGRPAAAPAA